MALASESALTQKLIKALKAAMPGAVIFKHSDSITSGVPDLSITTAGRTAWVEVKRGKITGKGLQAHRLDQLARAGKAYWVVFNENGIEILDPVTWCVLANVSSVEYVAEFLKMRIAV